MIDWLAMSFWAVWDFHLAPVSLRNYYYYYYSQCPFSLFPYVASASYDVVTIVCNSIFAMTKRTYNFCRPFCDYEWWWYMSAYVHLDFVVRCAGNCKFMPFIEIDKYSTLSELRDWKAQVIWSFCMDYASTYGM